MLAFFFPKSSPKGVKPDYSYSLSSILQINSIGIFFFQTENMKYIQNDHLDVVVSNNLDAKEWGRILICIELISSPLLKMKNINSVYLAI